MKRHIWKTIIIGLSLALILLIIGTLLSKRILTNYFISRTELREGRDIILLSNYTTGRSIILIGMAHVGKPEFYDAVRELLDSLRPVGYTVYFEGISKERDMDSLQLDTLQRKMRKVLGFHLTDYLDKRNMSRRAYNPKKYIAQDYEYLGLIEGDTCWVHADYTLEGLIAKYEEDMGEIILTGYDWQIPLNDKYERKKSGDTISYSKYHLVNTLRNRNLENTLLSSPHEKIVVLYGFSHIHQINLNLLKDSLNLTDQTLQ